MAKGNWQTSVAFLQVSLVPLIRNTNRMPKLRRETRETVYWNCNGCKEFEKALKVSVWPIRSWGAGEQEIESWYASVLEACEFECWNGGARKRFRVLRGWNFHRWNTMVVVRGNSSCNSCELVPIWYFGM